MEQCESCDKFICPDCNKGYTSDENGIMLCAECRKEAEAAFLEENTLDVYEQIMLAIGVIQRQCYSIQQINTEMQWASDIQPDKMPESTQRHIDGRRQVLKETLKKLAEAVELTGECLNCCDAVMPIDMVLNNHAYDILHGSPIGEVIKKYQTE